MKKKQKNHRRQDFTPKISQRLPRMTMSGISIATSKDLCLATHVDASGLRAIVDCVNHMQGELARLREDAHHQQAVEDIPSKVTAALVSIATNAWRAKIKMVEPETDQPKEDLRRIYRHVEGIFNAFDELGVKIVDPTGRAYDSGMALKVISFEQTPGLLREEIKETIKPSVTWNDRLIQMGEVIVGTPQHNSDQQETKNEQNNH